MPNLGNSYSGGKGLTNLRLLSVKVKEIRENSKQIKLVLTTGCFDLLHVGHLRYLECARALGDILIVGVNSDSSTKALKGSNRPVTPEADRLELVSAFGCVTYGCLFDNNLDLLKVARPDFFVMSSTSTNSQTPEQRKEEKTFVETYGGTVVVFGVLSNSSTSKLIEQLQSQPLQN